MRDKVFKNKKKLKGKGYSITESLTALRIKKLTKTRNSSGAHLVFSEGRGPNFRKRAKPI